jgi:hypothetical protein
VLGCRRCQVLGSVGRGARWSASTEPPAPRRCATTDRIHAPATTRGEGPPPPPPPLVSVMCEANAFPPTSSAAGSPLSQDFGALPHQTGPRVRLSSLRETLYIYLSLVYRRNFPLSHGRSIGPLVP